MAHIPYHPAEAARFPVLRRAVSKIAGAIVANFEARARRRRITKVEQLDDRMLKDIGITRTDLNHLLRSPERPDETLRRAILENRKTDLERPRLKRR